MHYNIVENVKLTAVNFWFWNIRIGSVPIYGFLTSTKNKQCCFDSQFPGAELKDHKLGHKRTLTTSRSPANMKYEDSREMASKTPFTFKKLSKKHQNCVKMLFCFKILQFYISYMWTANRRVPHPDSCSDAQH